MTRCIYITDNRKLASAKINHNPGTDKIHKKMKERSSSESNGKDRKEGERGLRLKLRSKKVSSDNFKYVASRACNDESVEMPFLSTYFMTKGTVAISLKEKDCCFN